MAYLREEFVLPFGRQTATSWVTQRCQWQGSPSPAAHHPAGPQAPGDYRCCDSCISDQAMEDVLENWHRLLQILNLAGAREDFRFF